ncbi:hypothetical protein TREMEDRAFT_19508, partial [Tremella mesenterica DSM 1558]
TTSSPSGTTRYTGPGYMYNTSKIVKTAVGAGIIVLVLTALVLFFKISSWIRYRQRSRRQHTLSSMLQSEQLANAYEIAAWSDEPGIIGSVPSSGKSFLPSHGDREKERGKWVGKKHKRGREKRGGANAYAVHEWEGVAA